MLSYLFLNRPNDIAAPLNKMLGGRGLRDPPASCATGIKKITTVSIEIEKVTFFVNLSGMIRKIKRLSGPRKSAF